jgi:hypothetical protein
MKPFLIVACSAIGLAVLATSASARYFEFYDCGKTQPFVSHDIIKEHDKSGNRTGAHSEFHDMRPGKPWKVPTRLFQAKSNKAKTDFTLFFRGRPCRQFPREEEAELFKRYGLGEPP